MLNRVFVVADATAGMGKALALDLAGTGAQVVVVARDAEGGEAVLRQVSGGRGDLQLCDLSILSSVRNVAEILKSKYQAIDGLVLTPGVENRTREVTVDGYEKMFAANYLGPFLLTNLLLGQLQAAVAANGSAHILIVTSPSLVPLDLSDLQAERNFQARKAFDATQTARLLFTMELARRLENTGIAVQAIRSGTQETSFLKRFLKRLAQPASGGIRQTVLQALTSPGDQTTTGTRLSNGTGPEIPAFARDSQQAQRLWELSEQLSDLKSTKGALPLNDPHLK